jgi:hypothetical protein
MDGDTQTGERYLGLMIADLDWSPQAMDGEVALGGPIHAGSNNCPDVHESQDGVFILGLRFGIDY